MTAERLNELRGEALKVYARAVGDLGADLGGGSIADLLADNLRDTPMSIIRPIAEELRANPPHVYELLRGAGIPLDNHESDLYAKVTPESTRILASYAHRTIVKTFLHTEDGTRWYDIPFAYLPFWQRRAVR